jgi:hypothetical protein
MLLSAALLSVALLSAAPLAPAPAPQVAKDLGAVEAFRRGDFETAQNLWAAVLEGEGGSGDTTAPTVSARERGRVLYDIGNAAYRRGNVLEAVGWYTASLRVRPRDADSWKNLEHARATAKLEPADRGDLASTAWRILSSLTLAESEWLALAGALVLLATLLAEALRGGSLLRRLAFVGLCIALASTAPWLYHRAHDGRDTMLVIEAAEPAGHGVDLHSEPRTDATVIGNVAAGEEVERQDELPGWVKVEIPGGSSGWIESKAAFALRR